MAITKEQALLEREFHYGNCSRHIGPRGGVTVQSESWRASGSCQTWKTRPGDFRLPVKYGMHSHGEITPTTAQMFHSLSDCTLSVNGEVAKMEGEHRAFVQERYLFHDIKSGNPDLHRFLCTCGHVSQDVTFRSDAERQMTAHLSEFNL